MSRQIRRQMPQTQNNKNAGKKKKVDIRAMFPSEML